MFDFPTRVRGVSSGAREVQRINLLIKNISECDSDYRTQQSSAIITVHHNSLTTSPYTAPDQTIQRLSKEIVTLEFGFRNGQNLHSTSVLGTVDSTLHHQHHRHDCSSLNIRGFESDVFVLFEGLQNGVHVLVFFVVQHVLQTWSVIDLEMSVSPFVSNEITDIGAMM